MQPVTRRNKSTSLHSFSQVPDVEIPRSSFDRSHGYKTTFDAGYLIPVFVDEALPGDTFKVNMTGLARMSTPLYPIMDNAVIESFFFAVPLRLVWENFKKFMGEQENPDDSTDYTIPVLEASPVGGYGEETIYDYMGLPPDIEGITGISALPFRAYNRIYQDWFKSQDLIDAPNLGTGDGPVTLDKFTLLRRGKRHDYFTSCLPWPQKSDSSVSLPLGTSAPVISSGDGEPLFDHGTRTGSKIGVGSDVQTVAVDGASEFGFNDMSWNDPKLEADLSTATAATINELRQAFQIQRLLERDARGGTRYTEIVRSHFGVVSPDARLQRAEYLGGGFSYVNVAPVAKTFVFAPANEAVGDLGAVGTALLDGHGFTKSFTEHSILIGLVSVRADLTYQQGINRMFTRSTKYDFFWPSLARLSEQAVLNKEIYAQGTSADDDVFGYQERYAEYRYKPSQVTGGMRSSHSTPLDSWHLAQDFSALPALNETFIEENPPFDRVIAVTDEPHFIFDAYFDMRCARPMPLYGVPGLIDHF